MTQKINIRRWFYGFATVHVFLWTIFPAVFRYTLPLDAMEGTTWGRCLSLGYDKDPFLNAWLTELAIRLGGTNGWMVYFFSQISVAVCFWAVWQLGKKFLSPVHALVSVFLLEFIASYNIDAIDFDDNVLELGLWALMILFFYLALEKQKIRDWVLLGIASGLAIMAKYYVTVLLIPMGIFLMVKEKPRKSFTKSGLYIGASVCALIIAPHFIWQFFHDFITVKYAFLRVSTRLSWVEHFKYSYNFVIPLLEACLLPLLVFGVLYIGKKQDGNIIVERKIISSYDWQFLLLMGFGPLVVTLLLSLFGNNALHAGWGLPLLSLFGIILTAFFQPIITKKIFYRFAFVLSILLSIALIAYALSIVRYGDTSTANYPGKEIAKEITQQWHSKNNTPLKYIVGPRWEVGVISLYSKDRPSVYIEADPQASFWIDEDKLKQYGALFVWNVDDPEGLPTKFYKKFPKLKKFNIKQFYWLRDKKIPMIRLAVAELPPAL